VPRTQFRGRCGTTPSLGTTAASAAAAPNPSPIKQPGIIHTHPELLSSNVRHAVLILQVTAFELYGLDAILDQSGKVWLLEVNASPSLGTSTPLDSQVKRELIRDVINLVDAVPFDRVALQHVLRRRQQQRTGPARRSRRQGGGILSGTEAEERKVLNTDLHAILKGLHPRAVGVMPEILGKFERIAPCPLLQQFQRMKRTN
jgi:hypothetical protein